MNITRKTAYEYGLFTDAATRFTKGQSPLQNAAVLAKAVIQAKLLAGGQIGKLTDVRHLPKKSDLVYVPARFINERLGLSLSVKEIKRLLENVEFKVRRDGDMLTITAPFWRTDIEIPEDIVEEVGRLYGYDHLPKELPRRDIAPAAKNPLIDFKNQLRQILTQAGANEVLTYSFVNERLLKAAGQDPAEAYHIRNALSPDLQYYRINLLPSLLEKVHPNVKNGYKEFALYEIGKGHVKGFLDKQKLPHEEQTLAAVITNPATKGAPYFQARAIADYIFIKLNITELEYQPLSEGKAKIKSSYLNCYQPERSAIVWSAGRALGFIGEPSLSLRQALKLPAATSMFELNLLALIDLSAPKAYNPLNRFPEVIQDICLKLPQEVNFQKADLFLWEELDALAGANGYLYNMHSLDIFKKPTDKTHYQITWRITLLHPERTLTTAETNKLMDDLAHAANVELKAERV